MFPPKPEAFITNKNQPTCITCKHFFPISKDERDISFAKCKMFGDRNVVTGKINYDYADYCRKSDRRCGYEAKYYEPLPITTKGAEELNKESACPTKDCCKNANNCSNDL